MLALEKSNPTPYYNICWAICGISYFFLFTTLIHFGCTQWIDPRIPFVKHLKKWKYFLNAHFLRVINLVIAIVDMTYEQLADIVTVDDKRVLRPSIDCRLSARIRMTLWMSSFYTYALFCWYKVAIVSIQSPDRNSPHFGHVRIAFRRTRRADHRHHLRAQAHAPQHANWLLCPSLLRRQHWFLDLLWYYIHLIYVVAITVGNSLCDPTRHDVSSTTSTSECTHGDRTHALIIYMVAVFIQFAALIIIFVTPLYQLMRSNKQRLFRSVFNRIKLRRKVDHASSPLLPPTHAHAPHTLPHGHGHAHALAQSQPQPLPHALQQQAASSSSAVPPSSGSSPAQQAFIARIKSTICRNSVAGLVSVALFSAFMVVYTLGNISGDNSLFLSGVGYVISFACYLLNYLCLTFSYQNHWPLLFPLLCTPPWARGYKFSGAKISLVAESATDVQSTMKASKSKSHVSSNIASNIVAFKLDEDDDDEYGPMAHVLPSTTGAVPIPKTMATHSRKGGFGGDSVESLLASSHLSATPKYHPLNSNDNDRMQKQYEEYLGRKYMLEQSTLLHEDQESTNTTETNSSHHQLLPPAHATEEKQRNEDGVQDEEKDRQHIEIEEEEDMQNRNDKARKSATLLTPSAVHAQRSNGSMSVPVPNDETFDSSENDDEYDSEGIDSLKLRTANY